MDKDTEIMIVGMKNALGETVTLNVHPDDTIHNLKSKIQDETGTSIEFHPILTNGQRIRNEEKLVDYIGFSGFSSNINVNVTKGEEDYITFPVSCIVQGCSNSKSTYPEKKFFALPQKEDMRQKWLSLCKREDLKNVVDLHLGVCSDHFSAEQFSRMSKNSLKDDAEPSLALFNRIPGEETYVTATENVFEEQQMLIGNYEMVVKAEPINYINEYSTDSEDENIRKHPGQLCRLCASLAGDVIYIFSTTGMELNIANKINSSLPILVKKTDHLPKQLCSSCVMKLDMCYQFSQSCIAAEEKLKSLVKLKQFWSCSSDETIPAPLLNKKSNKDSTLKTESGSSTSDKQTFQGTQNSKNQDEQKDQVPYCCPLCCEGRMKLHAEGVNTMSIVEDMDDKNDDIFTFEQSVEMNEDTNDSISEKVNDTAVKVDIDKHRLQNNIVYEFQREDGNSYTVVESGIGWWNDDNTLENAEIIIETLNSEEASVLCEIDGEDVNNWNLGNQLEVGNTNTVCRFCAKTFSSEELCVGHSKVHSEEGLYPCSLCGIYFSSEQDITSHFEQHRNEKRARVKASRGRLTCGICGRRFNSERTLNEHTCGNNETKQFRCETCKKAYISEERLAFHRKFHEGARPNYCGQCGKEFDNEGSLYYHTKMVHEGARPFCCEECGKCFYSNARLEAHKRVHSGERPFECEVCCRRFYDRETLKGHYITHMSVKPFQCDLCGVCCGRKSMLKQHMRTHHSEKYMPKRVPSLIHYFCKICNETFTTSSDVLTHRTTHWGTNQNADSENKEPKAHICEYCGESFTMINSLGKHRKQEHPDEQPYVCSICKETSRTLYEARTHRKTHTSTEDFDTKEKIKESEKVLSQKMFICEECGKPLPGRRKFLAHMKSHRMDFPFDCSVCGKKFTEKQRLHVHMRLHTGEKPYSCTECGKRFTQSSALYTHALLHTGEKPHGCDLCGKSFRIKADRDNHRRTHTGEKPYRCEFCSKQFRTGQVYYQHRMIHTGERRFPCDICGKAFKRSHTLVVHKRIHTGEKPNICDVCGRGFRQRTDMKKHRALHAV